MIRLIDLKKASAVAVHFVLPTVENYRDVAGLPNQNSGRFVTEGTLTNTKGVAQRDALSLHGNKGGFDELVVPDPAKQIRVDRVSGANPEF